MGRWTQYDEDAYRLPEGIVRTGYDADTGCYTFRDRTGTYTGLPGSQYGPMYPAGTEVTSKRVLVVVDSTPEKSRRMTLPGAFRSLRRSLTARRRRDQSSGSDDEEPVMVERPLSLVVSDDSPTLTAGSTAADRSSKLTRATSKTETSTTSRAAPPTPPKDGAASKQAESSKTSTPSMKIKALISSDRVVSKGNAKSATPRAKIQSPIGSALHSRSASTSAPRTATATPQGHTRRAASEHVHSPRPQRAPLPIAARFMSLPDTPTTPPAVASSSSRASPGPGTSAPSPQKPSSKRRAASEQTPSSSEQPTPSSTASPGSTRSNTMAIAIASGSPRTSAPLTRSQSTQLPRSSRTMALAMSPDPH